MSNLFTFILNAQFIVGTTLGAATVFILSALKVIRYK